MPGLFFQRASHEAPYGCRNCSSLPASVFGSAFGRYSRWHERANWNSEPVTYITSRRYTDCAYAIIDVKVYSNADSIELWINNRPVGSMWQEQCPLRVCLFKNVRLDQGPNQVVAVGHYRDESLKDSVAWWLNTRSVNIVAGQLKTGSASSMSSPTASSCSMTSTS